MSLTVGVCITTHNRCAELRRTLAALERLDPQPSELIVVADGCTDATVALLSASSVHVIIHAQPHGSVASRNEMAELCTSDLFVSLDDDSYPLETDFIARVQELFRKHPRLAVAWFPQRSDEFPASLTASDFGVPLFTGSFLNSGAAIRRDVFLALRKYPAHFFHAYEEPDFALRCNAGGWQVVQEPSLTIRHHYTATERNELRTHHRHARNELWSVLMRCPAMQVLPVVMFRVVRQLAFAASRGVSWIVREPMWWLDCLGGVRKCLRARRPVRWRQYLAWMRLVRQPLASEAEWAARFGHPAE